MKYIFLLLSTILLFSCTTYQTTYSSYDEVYDTYTPTVESSDVIEDEPVSIYFNVIDYDLWTYRYPNYRRYWFYNNYNYSYWSIYSNYWYLYNYPLNYWNQGYSWNYYYWGPYNYNYYNNYWYTNNFYNNYYYTNNYYNYYTNHHRPFYYGPRSGIQTLNRRPFFIPKTEQKKPTKPVDRPKQDLYIHSKPNHRPIKEDKPQRFESIDIRTKEPARTQPIRTNDTYKPNRTQQTKPQNPQRTQQTKPQNPQRTQQTKPQTTQRSNSKK